MSEEKQNWIELMLEREALPETVREQTTGEFCKEQNVPQSTYYYHVSKEENKKKVISIAINNAKKHAPTVLNNLGERGKDDNKAAELYMKFILQLAEKTDITSNGEKIMFLPAEVIDKNGISQSAEGDS